MRILLFTGAMLLMATCPGTPAGQEDASIQVTLKPGEGREVVMANCIPCHSTALVAANHMSREGWDRTITRMQTENGMWAIPKEVREMILDYLEIAQRVPDADLDAGRQSPWASPLYRPNPLW